MQLHRTIKADEKVGSVIVTYKVFPEDIMESFDGLKKKIEKCLPEFASLEGYGEEDIAFGLKALLVQVRFPEDKTGIVDEFETELGKIEHVSQVQTLIVRRSSR
jgi:elongation factor 1-beta